MRTFALVGLLASLMFINAPGVATASRFIQPTAQEEMGRGWEDLGRGLREWLSRWGYYFGAWGSKEERPLISMMLDNRERLGLSTEQVRNLEQLRRDYQKESIRREADLRIAEMDLDALLDALNVDMAKVEAKVRETERLRADMRLARIRTIEKGKQELTADQRKKLQELLTDSPSTRAKPRSEPGSRT